MIFGAESNPERYNPWRDLRDNWPQVTVTIVPMTGRLLGELDYPVIRLRAGTTTAQRRCTLTHELVHLERGIFDCGPWQAREERFVQQEVARRLVPAEDLRRAVRAAGDSATLPVLAVALDVDCDTLRIRLAMLSPSEREALGDCCAADLWSVA